MVEKAVGNVKKFVADAIAEVPGFISGSLMKIEKFAKDTKVKMTGITADMKDDINNNLAGINVQESFWGRVSGGMFDLFGFITVGFTKFFQELTDKMPTIVGAGLGIWRILMDQLNLFLQEVPKRIDEYFSEGGKFEGMIKAIGDALLSVADQIPRILEEIIDITFKPGGAAAKALDKKAPSIAATLWRAVISIVKAVPAAFETVAKELAFILTNLMTEMLKSSMRNIFEGLGPTDVFVKYVVPSEFKEFINSPSMLTQRASERRAQEFEDVGPGLSSAAAESMFSDSDFKFSSASVATSPVVAAVAKAAVESAAADSTVSRGSGTVFGGSIRKSLGLGVSSDSFFDKAEFAQGLRSSQQSQAKATGEIVQNTAGTVNEAQNTTEAVYASGAMVANSVAGAGGGRGPGAIGGPTPGEQLVQDLNRLFRL